MSNKLNRKYVCIFLGVLVVILIIALVSQSKQPKVNHIAVPIVEEERELTEEEKQKKREERLKEINRRIWGVDGD